MKKSIRSICLPFAGQCVFATWQCLLAGGFADRVIAAPPLEPFELQDGDRVALVGATFLEREQKQGYLETALVSRFPDRRIMFRNLAWSGDTVYGDARSYFEKAEGGFQRLSAQFDLLRPTVVIVAYGWAESWQGSAGVDEFSKGMTRLLDLIARHNARVVIVTPPRAQPAAAPLPDATSHNAQLDLYSKQLLDIASERGCYTMNLFALLSDEPAKLKALLTDNGIHFTAYGYWRLAPLALKSVGLEPAAATERIEVDSQADGVTKEASGDRISFSRARRMLPSPPAPPNSPREAAGQTRPLVLAVGGLAANDWYALQVDDRNIGQTKSGEDWSRGVTLADDPDSQQAERLREAIVKKNEMFFHRFRPANETYIFGFRKKEQGQNAVEIPQFDPLVAEQEQRIDELRMPPSHRYQLLRVSPPKR